jgi:hypothetical protein
MSGEAGHRNAVAAVNPYLFTSQHIFGMQNGSVYLLSCCYVQTLEMAYDTLRIRVM